MRFFFHTPSEKHSSTATMIIMLNIALAVVAVSSASASITCLKIGTTATARWTNAAHENCTWTGIVGSNFGIDPVTEGKYVLRSFKSETYFLLTLAVLSNSYACNGRLDASALHLECALAH